MIPTCDAPGHWFRAKSTERQTAIACGFPKSPSGKLIATSFAASGSPGLVIEIDVVTSGWAPASVFDEPTAKESIDRGPAACAETAGSSTAATTARRVAVIVLARIVCFSLLIVCASAVTSGRVAVVLAAIALLLHAAPLLLHKALLALRGLALLGRLQVAGPRDRVDHRIGRGLRARAVALIGGLARIRRRAEGEAPFGAGVVDLHRVPVQVLVDERLAGEEDAPLAIGAGRDDSRVGLARAGRDQLHRAVLPLVRVGLVVRVPQREGLGRGEEDAAVVGEVQPVLGEERVGRRKRLGR